MSARSRSQPWWGPRRVPHWQPPCCYQGAELLEAYSWPTGDLFAGFVEYFDDIVATEYRAPPGTPPTLEYPGGKPPEPVACWGVSVVPGCTMCQDAPGFCPRHSQAPVVAGRKVERG